MIDHHTDTEIADLLNQRGLRSCEGKPFQGNIIYSNWRNHHLTNRLTRMCNAGMLTLEELDEQLDVVTDTVKKLAPARTRARSRLQ